MFNKIVIFILAICLLSPAASTEIWVHQDSTSPGNGSSSDSPLVSLDDALTLAVQLANEPLQDGETYREITINVIPSTANYTVQNAYNFTTNASSLINLTIQSSPEAYANARTKSLSCNYLPNVAFGPSTYFVVSSLRAFNFRGIRFYPLYDNTTFGGSLFDVRFTPDVVLSLVCIIESNIPFQQTGLSAFLFQNSTCSLDNIVVFKATDITTFRGSNVNFTLQIGQLMWMTGGYFNTSGLISLVGDEARTNNVVISNVSFYVQLFHSANRIPLVSSIRLERFNSVKLISFTISNSYFILRESLALVQDTNTVELRNHFLYNFVISAAKASFFEVNNVGGFSLLDLTANAAHTYTETKTNISDPTKIYFVSVSGINTAGGYPNPNIYNITFVQSYVLYLTVISLEGNYDYVNVSTVYLDKTYIQGWFMQVSKQSRFDNLNQSQLQASQIWTMENIVFNGTNLTDFIFLDLSYDSALNTPPILINELDTIHLHRMQLINCLVLKNIQGLYINNVPWITNVGFMLNITEMTLRDNTFNYIDFIKTSIAISSTFIRDSQVINNTMIGTNLLQEHFREVLYVGNFDETFYTGNGSIYSLYRVSMVYNSTFHSNSLSENSYLLDLNNPFVFILNNTFSNCNLENSTLIRAGGFNPIPLDNVFYTSYTRNTTWENFIYGGDPIVLSQINSTIFQADQLPEEAAFQMGVLGNVFVNCVLKYKSFVVIDVYDFPNSAVAIANNEFNSLYLSGFYVETMISVMSANRLSLKSNLLFNLTGDGYAIHALNFAQNKFMNLSDNTVTSCIGPGYLKITAPATKFLIITHNNFANSIFNSTVFLLNMQANEKEVIFSNNSIMNLNIGSNVRIQVPIRLLYLKTPINIDGDYIVFSNNVFCTIGFLKKDPFITSVDRNTLIVISAGKANVTLQDNFFNATQVMYDDNYLAIAASYITIDNCTFINLYNYESIGAVLLLGENIIIQYSEFINCSATDQVSGGAIYIDYDHSMIDPINITIFQNIFMNNSAGRGGLLFMRDNRANIKFEKNYFFNNFAFSGSAIEFENVTFSNFHMIESEIVLALESGFTSDFLSISNSDGVMILEDLFVRLGKKQSGSLLQFTKSPDLSIWINNAEMVEVNVNQDLLMSGNANYTLLLENILQLLVADRLRIETDFHKAVSVTPKRLLQMESPTDFIAMLTPQRTNQPKFGSDPQTNLDVLLSFFTSASVQQFGFMELDSGNLTAKDIHVYALNLQSQPLFSVNCYSNVRLSLDNGFFDQLGFYVNDTVFGEPLIRSGVFDISSQSPSGDNNAEDCQHSITVTNSSFTSLFSNKNATVLNNRSPMNCTFNFTSNLFQNLKASQGTAINSISSDQATLISLRNNTFLGNQAFRYGGCIYNRNNILDIQNCTMAHNLAVLSGGTIYSETINDTSLLKNTNSYINNSYMIQHGSDIASNPVHISIEFDPNSLMQTGVIVSDHHIGSNCTLSNVTSYSFTQLIMYLKLYDTLNQSVYYNSSSVTTRFTFVNGDDVKTYTSSNYTLNMTGYGAIPTVELRGKSGTMYQVKVDYVSEDLSLSTYMTVNLRDCVPGEINQSSPNKCVYCERGTYSFDPSDSQCKICPPGADCPGGTTIALQKGRWRENTTTDLVVECFDSNDNNSRCLGGPDPSKQCATGYTGPLCSQCTFVEKIDNKVVVYAPSQEGYACQRCPSIFWNYLILIWRIAASMTFEVIACYIAWTNSITFMNVLRNHRRKTTFQEYFSSLLNYCQMIFIVSAFSLQSTSFLNDFQKIDTPFAPLIQGLQYAVFYIVDVIATPVTKANFIMECTLLYWGADPSKIVDYNIIILLASPFVKWVLMLIVQLFWWKFKLTSERKNKIIIDGLVLLVLEQPGIVYELYAYFECIIIDPFRNNEKYMGRALNNLCYTDAYNSFLYSCVIPGIILWIVVIPAIGLGILYFNRYKLNTPNMRLTMGCLYNAFDVNSYYWWAVINEFKVFLLIVGNIFADLKTRLMFLFVFIFIYHLFLERLKPYYDINVVRCEKYAIMACILTVTLALLLISNHSDWMDIIAVTITVVFNIFVFVFILLKMWIISKGKLNQSCQRLGRFFAKLRLSSSFIARGENDQIQSPQLPQNAQFDDNSVDLSQSSNVEEAKEKEGANDEESDFYEGYFHIPNYRSLRNSIFQEVGFVEKQDLNPDKAHHHD